MLLLRAQFIQAYTRMFIDPFIICYFVWEFFLNNLLVELNFNLYKCHCDLREKKLVTRHISWQNKQKEKKGFVLSIFYNLNNIYVYKNKQKVWKKLNRFCLSFIRVIGR